MTKRLIISLIIISLFCAASTLTVGAVPPTNTATAFVFEADFDSQADTQTPEPVSVPQTGDYITLLIYLIFAVVPIIIFAIVYCFWIYKKRNK